MYVIPKSKRYPICGNFPSPFLSWLDSKSDELYELSMNYSGYKLLNETYNLEIRNDAQFAWINFTSMIMNISKTISEVLYNKTLIVKRLSDLVEATYDHGDPARCGMPWAAASPGFTGSYVEVLRGHYGFPTG